MNSELAKDIRETFGWKTTNDNNKTTKTFTDQKVKKSELSESSNIECQVD